MHAMAYAGVLYKLPPECALTRRNPAGATAVALIATGERGQKSFSRSRLRNCTSFSILTNRTGST